MCVAIPAEVIELLPAGMARVSVGGAEQVASLALVGPVKLGDFVLLHVGFALSVIDRQEAESALRLLHQLAGQAVETYQDDAA
jgi:hydrogenase expression/formation protein HypC